MWKVTVKGLLAKKLRFVMTGFAVMLGVAFMVGALVLTATISRAFDGLFSDIYRHTDVVVREKEAFGGEFGSGRGRLPAAVLSEVKAVDGVAAADGTTQGIAQIVDRHDKAVGGVGRGAPPIGFGWIPDRDLSTFHVVEGRGPRAAEEIAIDRRSADKTGYKPGDHVPVLTKAGRQTYTLTGIVKFGDAASPLGASVVAFTPDTASRVLGQADRFDSIVVKGAGGISQADLARRVRHAVAGPPHNLEVITGAQITKESQSNIQSRLSFFGTFLVVFAVIALFVGSFIIFNTFSIIVAQRTREMALLRAIGAARSQVLGSVVLESMLVGLVASGAGIVAGIFLAGGLKALLRGLGLDLPAAGTVVTPAAVVWPAVTGLVVTVVAAVVPAVKASRVAPVAAMRDVSVDRSARSLTRTAAGFVVTAAGVGFLMLGLFGRGSNALQWIGLGAALVFLGVAVLGPLIARPVAAVIGAPMARLRGMPGTLARENAMRNPKRTSATAAALMIGVGLVGFIAISAASTKASISATFDKELKADYVIDSGSFHRGGLSPAVERDLAAVPEVTAVSGAQEGRFKVGGAVGDVTAYDPKVIDQLFDVGVQAGTLSGLGPDGLAVQRDTARDGRLKLGSQVLAEFAASEPRVLTVRAIYKEKEPAGDYVMSSTGFFQSFPDAFDKQVYLKVRGGPSPEARKAIESVLTTYPNGTLQDRVEFKASQAGHIDQLVNLVYALLALAVVIALFGITNTLGLSVIERTRELGLLRAVGMTRAQMRATVRWESVIIALLGTFLGLGIGMFFGWALVRALSSDGIDQLAFPVGQLAVVVVVAALAGVAAAWWPAGRAARLDVLEAIGTE